MTCRKSRYRDEIAAKLHISRIGQTGAENKAKNPVRAYRCPKCKGWHITSMPLNSRSV